MQLQLVAVGKLRPALRSTCDDYLRRFGRFVPITEREVREAGRAATVASQRTEEGRRIIDALDDSARVVILDQGGEPWSSEMLAERLDGWRADGRNTSLIIGGAVGLGSAVITRADLSWSLGPLTLPHELARVVVAEQLYRSATILRGEPYHKPLRST